jgi:hypothetical protein
MVSVPYTFLLGAVLLACVTLFLPTAVAVPIPVPVPSSTSHSLSPRSSRHLVGGLTRRGASYTPSSPASERHSAPDICQRPDQVNNPICNPNNYQNPPSSSPSPSRSSSNPSQSNPGQGYQDPNQGNQGGYPNGPGSNGGRERQRERRHLPT